MGETDTVRVSPKAITHKLSCDLHETEAADWKDKTYMPIDQTIKHRSIVQRYVEGRPWEETELFTQIYRRRFDAGQRVRGCATFDALLAQYRTRVDHMFADMRTRGYRDDADDLIPVVIAPDGSLALGNQGNHRLAMAQVLDVPKIAVDIRGRLETVNCAVEPVKFLPELPKEVREIPAMTTPAERRAYYELAKVQARCGAIVELGTWLGAATAYLAAGVRDAGVACTVHSYDRFQWQAIHEYKAGQPLKRSMVDQVKHNLGDLASHVKLHKGEIKQAKWDHSPIGLLIADGPKRISEIVRTLEIFGPHLVPGTSMAWQDFAYFPAYDLPAAFAQLERARKVTFERGVYPGTTGVFRIESPITAADVRDLSLEALKTADIRPTWEAWRDRLPDEMHGRFMCGAAMFLHERGAKADAEALFTSLLDEHWEDIASKWEYLKVKRPLMARRYPGFLEALERRRA